MIGFKKNNTITAKDAYKILMKKYPVNWLYYAEIDDEVWFGAEDAFEWIGVDKNTRKIMEDEYPARTLLDGLIGEPRYDDDYKKRLRDAIHNAKEIDWK